MTKQLLKIAAFVIALAGFASAQTILTQTTLASAVASSSTTTISLTSATGVTAANTVLVVLDGGSGEAMFVNSVNGTQIGVTRGYQSLGKARTHISGALVFVAPAAQVGGTPINTVAPSGSCTRANVQYLPVISLGLAGSGTIVSDCVGGVWVNGTTTSYANTQYHLPQPPVGASNSGTALGTSTATTQYETYCTEIDVTYNKQVTGIAPHVGATGGTDKWASALYDAAGNLVAQGPAAGVTVTGTAYAWQALPFTAKYYLVGPAVYFGCVITNGSTATLDLTVTGKGDQILTKDYSGTGFTVPTSITVPTSFNTATGSFMYLY